jgi:hypothetical protein
MLGTCQSNGRHERSYLKELREVEVSAGLVLEERADFNAVELQQLRCVLFEDTRCDEEGQSRSLHQEAIPHLQCRLYMSFMSLPHVNLLQWEWSQRRHISTI